MMKIFYVVLFVLCCHALFAATAPDFTVTDSDGKTHQLYADYLNKGKTVVIEVFFINCPPCAGHAPYWEILYQDMKAQHPGKVEFLMLSTQSGDKNTDVKQYKLAKMLTMPAVGSDGGSLTALQPYLSGQFGTFYGTPTFIVLAPGTGTVYFDIRGADPQSTMNQIAAKINQALLPICRIKTAKGETLQRYTLRAGPPDGPSIPVQVTGGSFTMERFSALPNAPFYMATPRKNDDPLNGVSTLDLLQINKRILGVDTFTYAWQFTAADANRSGTVSTLDIVELRKLILGIYDTLPKAPSWLFSPLQDTISSSVCPDFTATKIGDVNGTASPDSFGTPGANDRYAWPLLWENRWLEAGQRAVLAVRAAAPGDWQGVQVAWRFDPVAWEILDISAPALPDFGPSCSHLTADRLALSWFTDVPVTMPVQQPVWLVELRARQSGWTGAALMPEAVPLRPEAYDADGRARPLLWQAVAAAGNIWPNPARGYFWVRLPDKGPENALIQILDAGGHVVWTQRGLSTSGGIAEIQPGNLPAGWYAVQANGQLLGSVLFQ